MMPSLYSAVSGLKSNQEMMDVIGNNIANVNTPGFKSSSVNFADLLSQTMKGASMPTTTTGGTNPIQVGQGTSVASVDTNFTNGSLQQTGDNTDLGINGDGLFILGSGGNQYYTRDGDFSFDASGNLVSNANGMNVQGWMANAGTISASGTPTNIGINLNASTPAKATSNMVMSGNLNNQLNNGTLLFSNGTGNFTFAVSDGDAPAATGNWQLSYSPAGPFNTWNWTITDANSGSTLDAGTVTLDSTNGTVTNMTTSSGYTGTVGTTTANTQPLAATTITAGTNDQINLALNGGAATTITIPPSPLGPPAVPYSPAQLVAAVNSGIANSALSGSVTAALDGTGRLTFTSTSGSNAVAVSAGTNDASASLGFTVAGDAGIGTFTIQPPTVGGQPNAFSLAGPGSITTAGDIPALTFTPPVDDVTQTVYDAQGNQYTADIAFTKNNIGDWTWSVKSLTDSAGNTYNLANGGVTGNNVTVGGTAAIGNNLSFSPSGTPIGTTTGTFSLVPSAVAANGNIAPVPITINFAGLTQDDAANSAAVQSQDGYTSGTLQSYAIDQTGTITGSFSNGVTQALGQIALANFPNPGGLSSAGTNLYTATANSGTITILPAGTGSLGTIQTGSLEASNVDLSQEMSNMIIAQSGFDANSKVITTDDQLLQTLDSMVQA